LAAAQRASRFGVVIVVTLVSGWQMPLTDKLYSREKLIGLWRMLQNKQ
jgi:hypothetical protein